jgi:hypothetical protein
MEDKLITELKKLKDFNGNFSYDDVRKSARREVDVWDKLEHGHKILETLDECNQYWHSYAPRVKEQLDYVLKCFNSFMGSYEFIENNMEIIDYGCGQGGASIRFLDKYYQDFKTYISKIKLIEPSSLALQRARRTLNCYSSDIQIDAINKKLDDLTYYELDTGFNRTYIHLFSNILDVEGFDLFELFSKITKIPGSHFFIAVSMDTPHRRGARIRDIYESLIDSTHAKTNIVHRTNGTIAKKTIGGFQYRSGKLATFFLIYIKARE